MKDKIIDFSNFSQLTNNGRSLGTVSPVQNISGPTTTLFYDLRGSATYTSTPSLVMGTLDRWRVDTKDFLPLNRDQWIFYTTGTPSSVRIVEREKNQIPSHWTNELPTLELNYQRWTKDLASKKLKELEGGEKT